MVAGHVPKGSDCPMMTTHSIFTKNVHNAVQTANLLRHQYVFEFQKHERLSEKAYCCAVITAGLQGFVSLGPAPDSKTILHQHMFNQPPLMHIACISLSMT